MLLILTAVLAIAACGDAVPELNHDSTVPDDLRELADATWNDFLDAFPARSECMPAPTLHAAWELPTRAKYEPATATIAVRVPGTPATLRSELIHEFAHHLEFSCDAHADLRPGFLAAQGFEPATAWFDGDSWETTPSEQYAEAVVELIEGRRTHLGGIVISDAAIAVIAEWGSGAR